MDSLCTAHSGRTLTYSLPWESRSLHVFTSGAAASLSDEREHSSWGREQGEAGRSSEPGGHQSLGVIRAWGSSEPGGHQGLGVIRAWGSSEPGAGAGALGLFPCCSHIPQPHVSYFGGCQLSDWLTSTLCQDSPPLLFLSDRLILHNSVPHPKALDPAPPS